MIQSGLFFDDVNEMSNAQQVSMVRQSPNAILHLQKPSIEAQKIAVGKQPTLIEILDDPDDEVILIALNQQADLLKHIKQPSLAVQKKAIGKKAELLKYLEDPFDEVIKIAINQDWTAIININRPVLAHLSLDVKRHVVEKMRSNNKQLKSPQFNPMLARFLFTHIIKAKDVELYASIYGLFTEKYEGSKLYLVSTMSQYWFAYAKRLTNASQEALVTPLQGTEELNLHDLVKVILVESMRITNFKDEAFALLESLEVKVHELKSFEGKKRQVEELTL